MTDKLQLQRPPYVLAHPGDMQGCGYHRIFRPIEWLTKAGFLAARIEMNFMPDQVLPFMEPDVVIWQRQNEEHQIELMQKYRELLPNAFFVYELDDALGDIPDASWHKPYMDPNVDKRVPRAAAICDVITVTTDDLADHMRRLCPETPVRVVPNMLAQDDLDKVDAVKKTLPARYASEKLRIGWGGGVGHKGDLALLERAMIALKDEVEWVFLGYMPPLPAGIDAKFAGASPPQNYLQSLAALNVDLIVAPLEANHFNACKSNLRLIESAVCGYPVIATPFGPYLTRRPPVYAYADNTDEWVAAIRKFAQLSESGRKLVADNMFKWFKRHYYADTKLRERAQAWLPDNAVAFKARDKKDNPTYVVAGDSPTLLEHCLRGDKDVVYVRAGVEVLPEVIQQLADLKTTGKTASISVVSNDGGAAGFPTANQFAPLTPEFSKKLAALCRENPAISPLSAAAGPVIVLRQAALALLGAPDFGKFQQPELAILEWSVMASARGFGHIVDLSTFVGVGQQVILPQEFIQQVSMRLSSRWPTPQVDTADLTKFRQELELRFHRDNYRSPQPQRRDDYPAWVKVHDSMGPRGVAAMSEWFREKDRKVPEVIYYGTEMLDPEKIEGDADDWKFFVPLHTVPAITMIGFALDALEKHPEARLFYGDNDHFGMEFARGQHDFKPNYDRHLLLSRDYMTQALMVNVATLREILPKVAEYCRTPREQLYAVCLELALGGSQDAIQHIPRILAHLPPFVAQDEAETAKGLSAVAQALATRHNWNVTIKPMDGLRIYHEVSYKIAGPEPKVSIIMPTKNKVEMLAPALATLLSMTTYSNFEVLVVDNGSDRQEMLDFQATSPHFQDPRVRLLKWDHPYNWSELNNWAVECESDAPYLVFLNDDTRVLEPEWLTEMVGAAMTPDAGAIGARLSYPQGGTQHCGVVYASGLSGHMHKGLPPQAAGYSGIVALAHEATAVTGACLLVSRELYYDVGGLNTTLAHNFNDVAFCLDLWRMGKVNIVASRAHLQHYEGVTRTSPVTPEGQAIMQQDGLYMAKNYPEADRYWNPNLMFIAVQGGQMLAGLNMDQFMWPPAPRPWDTDTLDRIVLIGENDLTAPELRDGAVIYRLIVQGNLAQLVDPPMSNVQAFDLRDPETARDALAHLGATKVIMTGLENGASLLLSFVSRLGIPVTYRPVTAEAACPRRTLKPNGTACEGGWAVPGVCQKCIDEHGSPNGFVTADAWRADWARFFNHEHVEAEFAFLNDAEYETALRDVYGVAQDAALQSA